MITVETVVAEKKDDMQERFQRAKDIIFELFDAFNAGYMVEEVFLADAAMNLAPFDSFYRQKLKEFLAEHLNEIGRADLVEKL